MRPSQAKGQHMQEQGTTCVDINRGYVGLVLSFQPTGPSLAPQVAYWRALADTLAPTHHARIRREINTCGA